MNGRRRAHSRWGRGDGRLFLNERVSQLRRGWALGGLHLDASGGAPVDSYVIWTVRAGRAMFSAHDSGSMRGDRRLSDCAYRVRMSDAGLCVMRYGSVGMVSWRCDVRWAGLYAFVVRGCQYSQMTYKDTNTWDLAGISPNKLEKALASRTKKSDSAWKSVPWLHQRTYSIIQFGIILSSLLQIMGHFPIQTKTILNNLFSAVVLKEVVPKILRTDMTCLL